MLQAADEMTSFTVREVSGQEDEIRWDRFVHLHPEATGYHLVAWRSLFVKVFGHRTVYLFAVDGQENIRGIFPFALLSSRLFGTFAVSLPALNYGGVVADDDGVRNVLLNAAMEKVTKAKAAHLELRQAHGLSLDWPCKQTKVSMRLSLPRQYDHLWTKFPSKLRSQIRRAQKEGMETRIGGIELVEDFYRVFSRNMRDLGTPVYSRQLFIEIVRTFEKEARICVVYLQDLPVAAGFLYGFRTMLEIPWASASRDHNRLAPNMLLYSAVLQYACEAGYQMFDFGRSTAGSSTYRFKEQWGAQPTPLHWYYGLASAHELPEINPQNPKYRLAINLWKRLPLAVANVIGPGISRYLP